MENKFVNVMEAAGKLNDLVAYNDLDLYAVFSENCDFYIDVKKDCKLNLFATYFGKVKINVNISLGENSDVKYTEAFIGKNDENFESRINLIHNGSGSKCDVLIKGILFDNSRALSYGKLKIEKTAKKSNTLLNEHILLLSKNAKANAVPSLEIEADDVIAKHSASVTQIDDSKIFYLMSKGVSEDEAKDIIINGFFEKCFSRINDADMKEKYKNLVLEKCH